MSGISRALPTWYTKPNCTLCDAAWPHLRRATTLLGMRLRSVDITGNPELEDRYGTRIPVLALGDDVLAEGAMSGWQVWRAALRVRFRSRR